MRLTLAFCVLCLATESAVSLRRPRFNLKRANLTEHDIEIWYISVAGRKDRQSCMQQQIQKLGYTPHLFTALDLPSGDLHKTAFRDCIAGGEQGGGIYIDGTSGGHGGPKTKQHIISNTCSHKRLFSQLAKSNSTAEYFLILEDDAIIKQDKFKKMLFGFINEYNGQFANDWQMLQLDPYGKNCRKHSVGHYGGRAVHKPQQLHTGPGGIECANYFGAQALLMQKSQLESVVQDMESHKTLPMDWVPAMLPRGLSWRGDVAVNPITNKNSIPSYCHGTLKSSISAR